MSITCRTSVPVLLIGFLLVFSGCTAADRGNGDPDGGDGGHTLCVNPGDCEEDQKCLDGICRPLDYCETSEHCEQGFYCNQINSTCVEAECQNDSECSPGEYCDEGVCKLYCEGVQCEVGERCNPDNGQCEPLPCTVASVTCQSDADCAPGLHCDPVAYGCTECPPGFFCNIHECFALQMECRDHTDCAAEERCNPDTNKCEAYPDTCETDRDCTPKYCNLYTHACQDDPFTGECVTDEECHLAFGQDYYCHPRLKNCVLPLGDGECYDTPDCDDPGLVCDLKTNTCAPRGTVCGVDSDCQADYVCINGTCVYQCPPDKECVDDSTCASGEVCRNSCCVEDKSCSSDWDCSYPEICEAGWCQEPLPCTHDDNYEDNDDPVAATAINFPALNQTEDHPNLVICRNDDDWYKIDVLAGDKITVRLFFTHVSGGDLDMRLYDNEADALSGYGSVDSSTSGSDNEEVEHTAVVDSTYYVHVYGYSDGENTYAMQIEHGQAGVSPCSPDDAYEENDAWTTATPITLPAVGNTDLYQDMVMCADDEDWFAIEVPAGEGLTVRINFVDADGDLEMRLYDDTQTQLDYSTSASADTEEVTWTRVSTTATFYVKVYGYLGADNDYTMEVENPGGVVIDCTDGGLEPNDDAQSATPVIAGEHSGLFICKTPLDQDWYSVVVPAGGRLEASIAFDDDEGNLNLYLYESDGTTQVDSSTGYTDLETVFSPRVTQDTTFLINVAASTLTWDTPYTLTVVEHPPIDCSDAGNEPNDLPAAATSIGVGDQTGMIICQTDPLDVDWYSVSILDGERMHFHIAFEHAKGNLNLYLYESDGTTQLDSSTSYNDEEQVDSPRARGDSTFLVKVVSSTINFDTTYDISVTVDPPIQCTDDGWEPNDDFNQATPLNLPGIDNMIMCPGDADVFAINAVRTDRLNFLLVNESGLGDLDLLVYNDAFVEVGKSTTTGTGAENYSYDVYVDGTYYVVVEPKSGDAEDVIDYHLDVSKEVFTLCDTDAYEPNDIEAQATVLSDMQFTQQGSDWILELTGFMICNPGPFDWFALDLLTGDMVTIDVLFTNADGDIDAHLYDSSGTQLDYGTTTSDNETLDFGTSGAPADGRYYVRVKMYSSNTDSVYDIKVTADRAL